MVVAASVLIVGCSGEAENSEAQQRADAQAVAAVKAANTPSPVEPELQPMTLKDFEKGGLVGASCAFVVEDEILALAMTDIGALKYGDNVERFAPDAGSAEGPFDTRVKYDGREMSFRLTVSGTQERVDAELWSQPAELIVRDGYDRVIYRSSGTAECGT